MINITDKELYEDIFLPKNTFYDLKDRNPRQIELMKKGLLAERILDKGVFSRIKK